MADLYEVKQATRQLGYVRQFEDKLSAAEKARNEAIVRARSAGATLEEIAEAAGMSKQRVHQIVSPKTGGATLDGSGGA
jgi:predicted transcriptional regulator